jgi:hypothetical protein
MLQKSPDFGLFSGNQPGIVPNPADLTGFPYIKCILKYFSTNPSSIIPEIIVPESIFIWNDRYFSVHFAQKSAIFHRACVQFRQRLALSLQVV